MAFFKKEHKEHDLLKAAGIDTTGMSAEEKARLRADLAMEKYDKESSYRNKLPRPLAVFIGIILTVFSVFQLVTSIYPIPAQLLRAYHLCAVLVLVFLLFPAKKGMRKDIIPWYDWLLALLALAVTMYIPIRWDYLVSIQGIYNTSETVVGIIGILLIMEACRRVVGVPIMVIVSMFLIYVLFGHMLPAGNLFTHRKISLARAANYMFFTTEGVFGTPIGVSATYIFLFILFGSFLEKTGVGKLFIDFANAIAGKRVGGPAKVAVISSALQGTVSGSSVANTVSTGSFTIPAMKKLGYKPEFAGAVEAAASTGGQLMPPIMGAAAFLMAETTGIPYSRVVLSAVIPAILYFSGILISVHHEARKCGLKGMDPEDIPSVKHLFSERGHLLMPLVFMIYILATGMTPAYAALGAILSSLMAYSIHWWAIIPIGFMLVCLQMNLLAIQWIALGSIAIWVVVMLIRRETGFSPMDILEALQNGARNVLAVAVACAMAGMIVGSVTMTGLGLKFANALAALAGNNLLLMMFFTMLACILLGMGVPTTANYLITSTICAPAIISMLMSRQGLSEATLAITMSAHLFVFYFGIIADITPPVALAAMAGAAIAKGEPFKTGVNATRIAIGAFIVPYIFVLNPAMLMIDVNFFEIISTVITALVGMYAVSGGLAGFVQDKCTAVERLALVAGGLCMIKPGYITDVIGLAVTAAVIFIQLRRVKKA
ncbi:MAG: TRAP transporter permease [Candidatus Heteroscillospira sp.]|jgi:TRAP transporter 4TM/12TM fusion protein